MMAEGAMEPHDIGERRLRGQRRRYAKIVGWVLGISALLGATGAIVAELWGRDPAGRLTLPPAAAIVFVAAFLVIVVVGSWLYFRTIDELELEANKWASLIGVNVYAVLFPCWWVLSLAKVTPPPDDWAIYAATFVAAILAFLWRRLR